MLWKRFQIDAALIITRYCECFASGTYCDGCNCTKCHNTSEHEALRKEAVEIILERNPDAFRPKIANSPVGNRDGRVCSLNPLLLGKTYYSFQIIQFQGVCSQFVGFIFSKWILCLRPDYLLNKLCIDWVILGSFKSVVFRLHILYLLAFSIWYSNF